MTHKHGHRNREREKHRLTQVETQPETVRPVGRDEIHRFERHPEPEGNPPRDTD